MAPIARHLTWLFLVVVLVACGAPVDPNTPPDIVYGEDVCDRCGMIISDERFAAGVVIETAPDEFEHRIFDDIGGMLDYIQEEGDQVSIVSSFVHDYPSRAWLDARDAFYVLAPEMPTPMGFGLAAFAERAAAEAEAALWQGHVLDFEAVGRRAAQPGQREGAHDAP